MATNEQTEGILLDLIRYALNIVVVVGGVILVAVMLYILVDRAHPVPERAKSEAEVAQVEPGAEASGGTEASKASEAGAGAEGEASKAEAPAPEVIAMGAELFHSQGCVACHTIEGVEGAVGAVGPNLTKIGITAEERAAEAGVADAAAYIHQSIVDPNAYVAPDCPTGPCIAGMMPATFGATLSEEQIDALVQFLLSQKGEE